MSRRRAIALLIAGALVFGAPAAIAAQTVKSGILAWQKGDYKAAVDAWRPLAERGESDALFNLAQAYRFGRGVPANLATAQSLFERAASGGHVESQTTLGLLLLQSGDQLDALKWLKSAAEAGDPRALLVYGTALINGDGVTQDRLLGYAYVHAAGSGLAAARKTLVELDKLIPAADRRTALDTHKVKVRGRSSPSRAAPPATPTPKRAAETARAPSGAWRIQLGAFTRKGAAEALFGRLSGQLAGRQAFYVPAGGATRLQVGPYDSRAAAQSACAKLKGQSCFVVAKR
ncbi:MAG: SPOR domain-containing protein [Sphingomicrobium sp.]